MNLAEHHLSDAKLENARKPPPKAIHGDLAFNIRQPLAAGANERSRIIRGAPASLEDQRRQLATCGGVAGAFDLNKLRRREPVLVGASVSVRGVVVVLSTWTELLFSP